ncbi:MAG TPA: hypothetical protein DDW52_20370 [Planctomycetaceae bacterium]|nr:hypothetical protein [Planctomycetaceae bacterium]
MPFFDCKLVALCLFLLFFSSAIRADERSDFFERKIRPVLVEHCYECHSSSGSEIEAGLRVDDRNGLLRGGDSGPAVVPKRLKQSLLLSAIKYEDFAMPPDQKLPDQVIRDFEHWIADGAFDPREPTSVAADPSTQASESGIDYRAGKEFWSFQPIQIHALPKHGFKTWSRGRIDDFVAAKIEQAGLVPSQPAKPNRLLRRLSFDLTGLPPDQEVIDRLASTGTEDIVGQVVDYLLASDAFGEHWARMWLDLMRFADDQAHIVGNNSNLFFPNAFRYRDWVIDSLNDDLPYDRFIQLQLAADLVTPDDSTDDVALGFIGLGPKYYRRNSPEVQADEWEDRVDVLSRGLLGLTVACARCHDHKYDPIGTADYYALAGVFASIEMYNRPLNDESEKDGKGHAKKPQDALHIVRDKSPTDLAIMIRGDVKRRGEVIPRGFLTVLGNANPQSGKIQRVQFTQGSGRLELAEQLVRPQNPLVARVFVNRVWGQLIGKPLVGTPSNFGSLGQASSHPKLLDDLSARFIESGWSLKWLCREIVMSATYQQTSLGNAPQRVQRSGAQEQSSESIDPENRWLSRMNRKRLSVEQWRDALLVHSRLIDPQSRIEHLDAGSLEAVRRTVYCDVSRLDLNPMLALFDFPDPNVHSGGRAETITPSQKLFLMNSPFMVNVAKKISEQVELMVGETKQSGASVTIAYELLFARQPSEAERELATAYVSEAGLQQFVHGLLMSNETYILD